jgi:hypothetical protein
MPRFGAAVQYGRMPFMGDDTEAEISVDEELPPGGLGPISFDELNETEFEEFCYDLLIELGFVNVDWRKGRGWLGEGLAR